MVSVMVMFVVLVCGSELYCVWMMKREVLEDGGVVWCVCVEVSVERLRKRYDAKEGMMDVSDEEWLVLKCGGVDVYNYMDV